MNEYVKLRVSDLEKAWENECSEVRDALKRLYPDDLPPTRPKENDVTGELEFVHERTFFVIKHNEREIARQRKKSVVDGGYLTIEFFLSGYGIGNYKFKKFDGGNWQLLKVET